MVKTLPCDCNKCRLATPFEKDLFFFTKRMHFSFDSQIFPYHFDGLDPKSFIMHLSHVWPPTIALYRDCVEGKITFKELFNNLPSIENNLLKVQIVDFVRKHMPYAKRYEAR